ncbi:MAG: recombination protein O N-terminal domain-containing protein [Verrucomicrobiota bacterium]
MATLIRTNRLTETSLIVHWCSEQRGLIKTAAKGALRPKSPFAGKLDLFFEAELIYVPSRTGDLHTLREVSVVQPRASIRNSYESTLAAAYFVRWVEIVSERETPIPELADLLRRALDFLSEKPLSRKAVNHFEMELARFCGLGEGLEAPVKALAEMHDQVPAQLAELRKRAFA